MGRRVPGLVLVLVIAACDKRVAPEPPVTATTSSSASPASDCATLTSRFAATFAARDQACQGDADCACFRGGMPASPCGGVTSKKSAAALDAIVDDFDKHACRSGLSCAAWACHPKCDRGRCSN